MGENLHGLGYGDAFLDAMPKVPSMKEIIDKLDLLKLDTTTLKKTMSREL